MKSLGLVYLRHMAMRCSRPDSAVLLPEVVVLSIFHMRGRQAIDTVCLLVAMRTLLHCGKMSGHLGCLVVR
jgi:hypothetical protein